MVVREFCPPLINEGRTPLPPHGRDGDAAATPPSVLSEGRCLVDAPDPPPPFCGSRVEANWRGRHDWYAAVVMRVRGDGMTCSARATSSARECKDCCWESRTFQNLTRRRYSFTIHLG